MNPCNMVEWELYTFAAVGIVEHDFPGAYTAVDVGLPEYTCPRPVFRCADAIILHQPEGILGSELGAEEKIEVVLLISVQSLCNSL